MPHPAKKALGLEKNILLLAFQAIKSINRVRWGDSPLRNMT
jgi:hypothetical protein